VDVGDFYLSLLRWIIKVLRVGVEDDTLETVTLLRGRKLAEIFDVEFLAKFIRHMIEREAKAIRLSFLDDSHSLASAVYA
jgi:hypothetical protein